MKKQLPYFIFAFALPILLVLWWWGLFSSATVSVAEAGNYRYAYIDAQGVYSKLGEKEREVLYELNKQGITAGAKVTLVLTDPRTTPHNDLRARTGYMISQDAIPRDPLKIDTIPKRMVAVAQIKAHPLLAYGKTYSALLDYSAQHSTALHMPTLEIVKAGVLQVEMPLESVTGTGEVR